MKPCILLLFAVLPEVLHADVSKLAVRNPRTENR